MSEQAIRFHTHGQNAHFRAGHIDHAKLLRAEALFMELPLPGLIPRPNALDVWAKRRLLDEESEFAIVGAGLSERDLIHGSLRDPELINASDGDLELGVAALMVYRAHAILHALRLHFAPTPGEEGAAAVYAMLSCSTKRE